MDRGLVVFVIVFLLLPLAALAAVIALPAAGFVLAFFALLLLATGFTVALGFVPVEA